MGEGLSGAARDGAARSPAGAASPRDGGAAGGPADASARDAAGSTIALTVNGEARELPAGTTVAHLLATLGATGKPCAVEIDRAIVPRSEHATRALAAGDAVEIVSFVGGG